MIIFNKILHNIFISIIFTFAWSNTFAQSGNTNLPNIILIVADDLGYGDVSAYGGSVDTPNIDRLIHEGLKFNDFHTNGANCSPTRAALITGRYQQRVGIEGALGEGALGLGAPEAEGVITMADYLRRAGYKTGKVGKWHLGYNLAQSPIHFGFDRFIGMLHGATDYHSHVNTFGRFDWWHNDNIVKEEGYITDLITEHSIRLLEEWRDETFFLFVSHLAIHFPWQTPEDEPHRIEGKQYRGYGDEPLSRYGQHHPSKYQEVAAVMIEELDKSVGKILDQVYELGIENETIILFTSDNGGIIEASGYPVSSNGNLRGAKHSLYEGGHRVPAVAWWPGFIPAAVESDETIMTMDLLPTFMELANIKIPESNSTNALDGISIVPHLIDRVSLPSRVLYWKLGNNSKAVRSGDWKLIVNTDGTTELYYLANDIGEENDLSETYTEITRILSEKINFWINSIND